MEKYAILLGYFDKQLVFVSKLYKEITIINLSIYEARFLFAMRVQQFYTAIEDLLKQIAKSFENHINHMSNFHKELLARMNTEVPKIRPVDISHQSFIFLDRENCKTPAGPNSCFFRWIWIFRKAPMAKRICHFAKNQTNEKITEFGPHS